MMSMEKYHYSSPHRAEAIRVFDVIQQLNASSSNTLNAEAIDKFLKNTGLPCRQDLVKFMHSIDKEDKQMRQQYWGYCISRALFHNKLTNELDYLVFHSNLKELLTGTYIQPLQNYEKWDGNDLKNQTEKDEIYARIISICGQLSLFIKKLDYSNFNSNIQNINSCFSLITLMPDKKNEIYQIYQNILGGNFIEMLQFGLTMNVSDKILIQMLKSLCYLYQSLKYEQVRKILQPTFLLQQSTLKGLMQNINDKRPQIRYYTCAMMGIIVNNVKTLPSLVLGEKDLLYSLSNGIAQLREQEGLLYGLQFLIGVIGEFSTFNPAKVAQNKQIISVYLNFAIKKLSELKSQQTQATCIKLVSEVVKVIDLVDDDLKILKFINNVFEGPNQKKFQNLYQKTLCIVQNALIFNRKNVKQYILGDKSFQNYLKRVLKRNHQQWQPFYLGLQIILIIAQSQSSDILYQRDLLNTVFELGDSQNGLVQLYLSEIVLNLILNSLQSEWKITYLYEKDCLRMIGVLIGKYYARDIVLFNQYRTQTQISYSNRQVFVNCIKALYFLNFQTGNLTLQKKKQLYAKNFSNFFVGVLSDGFLNYFNVITTQKYLGTLLKYQQSVGRNINQRRGPFLKMFKLMSTVIEQMTFTLRKKNTTIEILKQVNEIRNEFHINLYRALNYNELMGENIPIYLIYSADINGTVIKQRVFRLSWNQFRSLLWDFIKKVMSLDSQYFKIIDVSNRLQIKNEDDYRRIIEKTLMDFARSNFIVEVAIIDIRQKQQQIPVSTSPSLRVEPNYRGNVDFPRFMSYKMPQVRDLSPFSSKKMTGSMMQRNPSPNFGTPCRECQRNTTNRSHICNACVNKHSYN